MHNLPSVASMNEKVTKRYISWFCFCSVYHKLISNLQKYCNFIAIISLSFCKVLLDNVKYFAKINRSSAVIMLWHKDTTYDLCINRWRHRIEAFRVRDTATHSVHGYTVRGRGRVFRGSVQGWRYLSTWRMSSFPGPSRGAENARGNHLHFPGNTRIKFLAARVLLYRVFSSFPRFSSYKDSCAICGVYFSIYINVGMWYFILIFNVHISF